MLAAILITFRETFEVALVIGILLTFLTKTNQLKFKKYVFQGAAIGIGLSLVVAFALQFFFGGLEGRMEQLFEGTLLLVTATFLTWMVLWVHRQKDTVKKLKEKVAAHAKQGYGIGIIILIASSVFREGTETVLYLKAGSAAGASNQIAGGIIGIGLALLLGYAIFRFAVRINLSLLFNITAFFLLLFAAGLVARGVHEFQELGYLPIFSFDPLWNISSILDHRSLLGTFLSTLFGYTSNPTTLELVSYTGYILSMLVVERVTRRLPTTVPANIRSNS